MKQKSFFYSLPLLFLLLLFMSLTSCRKWISLEPPAHQVVAQTAFSDDQTATATVSGLYSELMKTNLFFLNGAMSVYPALSGDELFNTAPSSTLDPFSQNALSADNNIVSNNIWRQAYSAIYHCNAVLEGLQQAASVSAGTKERLKGEVLLVRALCYFYLVNLFGDVPLVLTTDYTITAVLPRTSVAQVYDQISTDLQAAEALLPEAYPATQRVRPNKWTATALLARVFLYEGNWSAAEAAATDVLHSGAYRLEESLDNVFLYTSREAIWQLMPVLPNFNTAEGFAFNPSSATARPTYALTPHLLNAFEAGDGRRTAWVKERTVGSTTYHFPGKYKVRSSVDVTEYNTVLRLAELYLVRAEARAQQERITEAREDLDTLRTRAGLAGTAASDKIALLEAIAQERQVELFAEWGHRWFDLKRTGRIDAVLGSVKSGWQATNALFPLPQTDLQRNPALEQNPGY